MSYCETGKRDIETLRGKKRKKSKIESVSEKGSARERDGKKERGMTEVSLWMWSLNTVKCCDCCEHPSNGKSMMGRALRWSQGCYIKAEVLHQRFAGSKYRSLFGFVGLLNPFHWFPPLTLLETPYSFLSSRSVPTGPLLRGHA